VWIQSTKLVAIETSLEGSKKKLQIVQLLPNSTIHVNFVRIGPADVEIICLTEIAKKLKTSAKDLAHIRFL